jgi:hypothetical protein
VPVVVDDVLDALDDLFRVELGHVGVLEDEFVSDPALANQHFSWMLWCASSVRISLIIFSYFGSYGTL